MPIFPGIDARIPPLTPLFAGTPTSKAHWPAASYIPQVCMTLSTSLTHSRERARSPLTGQTQPLASVAPITARSWDVTVTRALLQVQLEDRLDVAGEHAVAAHQVSRCAVAVRGPAL